MPEIQEPSDGAPVGPDDAVPASRRAFVKLGVGAFGVCYAGAVGYPIYRYLASPAQRAAELAAVTEVSLAAAEGPEPGTAKMFRFGTRPTMLIHHADGSWSAFDAVCTHLGCTVQYQGDRQRIFCACHGGTYDPKSGSPIAGPPPKALAQYKVEVSDERIVVSRG